MAYPIALSGLTTREAITDTIYRALRGFDRHDIEAFNSAFIGEDVTFELDGDKTHGLSTIRDGLLAFIGPLDTRHIISNVRVYIKEGANTARLMCYALAQHCPTGKGKELAGPKFLAGNEYDIDLELDPKDGLWKIKTWVLSVVWRQGDAAVMAH